MTVLRANNRHKCLKELNWPLLTLITRRLKYLFVLANTCYAKRKAKLVHWRPNHSNHSFVCYLDERYYSKSVHSLFSRLGKKTLSCRTDVKKIAVTMLSLVTSFSPNVDICSYFNIKFWLCGSVLEVLFVQNVNTGTPGSSYSFTLTF